MRSRLVRVKILVLGSGAREHAIILSLLGEDADHTILAAPGNAGIAQVVETVELDPNDPVAVANYAIASAVELVVIRDPGVALDHGAVDGGLDVLLVVLLDGLADRGPAPGTIDPCGS